MEIIFLIIILIFSVIIHEVAHGATADYLGDPTARYAGRLTFNPIKHLDPVGSFLVPFFLVITNASFIFGWAKPVPVNPYNFNDQKYGQLKVALSGPLANLSVALFFGLIIRFFPQLIPGGTIFLVYIVFINILLAVFNLIPIPPLDGSHVLFSFFPRIESKVKGIFSRIGLLALPLVFIFVIIFFPVILRVVFFVFRTITGTDMYF